MFAEMSNENRNPFEFLFSKNLMKKFLLSLQNLFSEAGGFEPGTTNVVSYITL